MNYRFDKRTQEEFIQDIEKSSKVEHQLMEKYVNWLNIKYPGEYSFIDNGIDNTGKFILNSKDVTLEADFILKHKNQNKPDRKIEIKHCNPDRSSFHLKIPHIEHCVNDDVCIVNWMGVETENPRFCILTPKDLKLLLINGERKQFWHKPCIRCKCNDFEWYSLNV